MSGPAIDLDAVAMTAGEVAESVARADSALAPACADFVAKMDGLFIAAASAVSAPDARNAEGIAAKAAEVCLSLDLQLSAALAEIQSLKAAFAAMCEQRDAATQALENLENDDGAIPPSAWEMVQAAIERAGGTPKPGPPDSDIRVQNAALAKALSWAMATLKKASYYADGGATDVCWNAIHSHEGFTANALLANDQPEEETP